MRNRLRGVVQRFGGQGCSQVRLHKFRIQCQGLLEGGERLRRVFLLKFELAEFKLRNGQARVEAGNLLKFLPGGLRLAGLGEGSRVIQVGADMLRFERRGLLQMFQRRLRLLLFHQQNSQVQPRVKKIGRKLQGLLVGLRPLPPARANRCRHSPG